ncbi:cytochrome c biogenesis protein ResB [Nocardiopsis sp. RSe5-2]|uniref:Cytochrome c biogenesis protein ResB n=1 Tax=Nocardiopsis endophytica TaxID=3018445 RepID=A0ABT4UC37_9ACTN|nr:cytochrome c biogenesis protein ResB [Nocardiopsis endophytica]MDA2814539.1 cytochrome c biogenesis protein ResB [Nocardiopsis endophytica]
MATTSTRKGGKKRTDGTGGPAAGDGADAAGGAGAPGGLSPLGWARWAWRILTSMRTALILLFLLALGAIPGSMLPQRVVSPDQVAQYYTDNPSLAPWLERFYLFDVYSSPWYAAIYLLLFVSLTGCVIPRALAHLRLVRARPPKTPRNLGRMPYSARFTTGAEPERVLEQGRSVFKRYRLERYGDSLSGEAGYLREAGNVIFHIALLGLLVSLAAGYAFGYRGNMLVVEGDGFANTLTSYDSFYPGVAADQDDLAPFSFTLDSFDAKFVEDGGFSGQAESFAGEMTYKDHPGGPERHHTLEVNKPLSVGGVQVYLLGHAYAPEFEVRDGEGEVVFDQPVPFLPRSEDPGKTADGVVKVPDALPEGLGFEGVFLPTAQERTGEDGEPELASVFPGAEDPAVTLTAYSGDLGMRQAQSVYQLDTSRMEELGESGTLRPGDTWELPDGAGEVTFTGYKDFATLQMTHNPGRLPALLSASLAVLGLLGTLFVRPRRAWVRASAGPDGRTVVEVAGLGKTESTANGQEFHRLATELRDRLREDPAADGPASSKE